MNQFKACFSVAKLRFLEAFREPFTSIMLALNLIFLILIGIVPFFTLNPESEAKIQLDASLSSVFIFSLITTIYFSSNKLSTELENRTLMTIFSKPASKMTVLTGNYIGIAMISFIFFCFSFILTDFMLIYSNFSYLSIKDPNLTIKSLYISPSRLDVFFSLACYFIVVLLAQLPLLAISLSISLFGTFFMNLSVVIVLFSLGNALPSFFSDLSLFQAVALSPFPRMDLFNLSDTIINENPPDFKYIALAVVYSCVYATSCLALGSHLLTRKDIA